MKYEEKEVLPIIGIYDEGYLELIEIFDDFPAQIVAENLVIWAMTYEPDFLEKYF